MATLTTEMGLLVWNLASDRFNYDELATNLFILSSHDHTSGKGVQVPTGGIADNAITQAKMADAAIGTTELIDNSVTPAKLASSSSGTRKHIHFDFGKITNALVSTSPYGLAAGAAVLTGTNQTTTLPVWYLSAADYTVAGLNTLLSVRANVAVNATAPAVTITAGLHPVSAVTGTATNINYTIGAAVTGSTVAFASPAASSLVQGASTDFVVPADGYYVLGFTLSATPAANSVVGLRAGLGYKHA
jgi:hypothetical protein